MVLGQVSLAVEHNFETAHRLPFLGGKCENLHGHSWHTKVHFQAYDMPGGMDENGISIEYASVKKVVRQWIDTELDHGTMLGMEDPLVESDVYEMLGKVFLFGTGNNAGQPIKGDYEHRPWPTVEAVSEMLCVKLQEQFGDSLWIIGVEVRETDVNTATFTQAVPFNKNVETVNG